MEGMNWIDRAQDRDICRAVVSKAMNLRISLNAGNFLTSYVPISFSGRTLGLCSMELVGWFFLSPFLSFFH
jgi:hypothetical protein